MLEYTTTYFPLHNYDWPFTCYTSVHTDIDAFAIPYTSGSRTEASKRKPILIWEPQFKG